MSKLAAAALAAAPLLTAATLVDDYRAQARLTADHYEGDCAFGANGTVYLDPVTTDGLPLAEAAFLNRSTCASIGAAHFEPDGDFDDADAFNARASTMVETAGPCARRGSSRPDSPSVARCSPMTAATV